MHEVHFATRGAPAATPADRRMAIALDGGAKARLADRGYDPV